jgi:hypothetical protein
MSVESAWLRKLMRRKVLIIECPNENLFVTTCNYTDPDHPIFER